MEAPSFDEVGVLQQALRDGFKPMTTVQLNTRFLRQNEIALLNAQGKRASHTTIACALP